MMKIPHILRVLAWFAAAGFISLFTVIGTIPAQAASREATSYIRVIHASPYVGTADVFVDGQALLSSFQFASVTDYVPLPAGTHKVQLAVVGKGINGSVLTQDLSVDAGSVYTVAALGTQPDALKLQVFVDDNRVVPNEAKVRIYHLAPDAGQINVTVGEETTLKNVGYIQASDYLNESVGPCPFLFDVPQYSKNLTLTADLQSNMITSVFAVGLFQGDPKIQLVQAETPGIPGAPNTGSDPTAVHSSSVGPWLWSLCGVLLLLMGAGLIVYRNK